MASGFENEEKISQLPTSGVHLFAANGSQIKTRRIVTIILMVIFLAGGIISIVKSIQPIIIGGGALIGLIISLFVFIQTFLIEKFRVAVDYYEKKIILRYRYSLISIPFDCFDARDGEPDRAEQLLEEAKNNISSDKINYLVLDNVFEEACYQTSSKDLATKEDFFKLRQEALAIADAYGARNSEDAIKMGEDSKKKDIAQSDLGPFEGNISDIVDSAMNDEGDSEDNEDEASNESEESKESKE